MSEFRTLLWNREARPLLVILLATVVFYAPCFWKLITTIWSTEQQGHGSIVLCVSIYLLVRALPAVFAVDARPAPGVGWSLLLLGLLMFVLGISQNIRMVAVASVIFVLGGNVLVLRGWRCLRILVFPLFFMIFMIPLPGPFVDAVTAPMKSAVSQVVASVLFLFNYPIARSGVTLQIGPYQLLVADACAGLHTLFSLEALGLLYLNLVRHESWVRNLVLTLLIVPISFTANVIRVCSLTLITYYLGDEAGQGFLHGFAGMVLFLVALLLIVGADSLLRALEVCFPGREVTA